MTDKSAPWEEENRRWGWLHLAPKKIKAWVFLLCALWLTPLLSQLGDSGLNKLVWSCFGHPVYSSPYKPQGFIVDTCIPGEACHCPNSSFWRRSNCPAQGLVPGGLCSRECRLVWHMLPEPYTYSQESSEIICCELMT